MPGDPDPEIRKSPDCHVNIGHALHRRNQMDLAVFRKERKNKQQAADELAADVAGNLIDTGFKAAADGEGGCFFLEFVPLLSADILIDIKRSGKQALTAG